MDLSSIPFFHILRTRLSWLEARNQSIAENIANADTPRFKPHDLQKVNFKDMLTLSEERNVLKATNAKHFSLTSSAGAGPFKVVEAPDREAKPDGNAVVLEDQMIKLSETQMSHQTAISLYKKGLDMLRLAVRGA